MTVLVVGIGNPDRGDDGVGPLAVRRLAERLPPEVALIERPGDALALIDDWAGQETVILVDAAVSGATPGTIHRIDLLADAMPPGVSLSSTHAFGVADAVGLARSLGLLPRHLVAYAVEASGFSPGAPLSAPVAAALDGLVERVVAELSGHLPPRPYFPMQN